MTVSFKRKKSQRNEINFGSGQVEVADNVAHRAGCRPPLRNGSKKVYPKFSKKDLYDAVIYVNNFKNG